MGIRRSGGGIGAIAPKPRPGRARFLDEEQREAVAKRVRAGATAGDGTTILPGKDLQRWNESQFGTLHSLSGIYHLLRSMGFGLLSPRPRHPQPGSAEGQAVLRSAPPFVHKVRARHPGKRVSVLFEDEARLGQHGTLARVWAEWWTGPVVERQNGRKSVWVFGAVKPLTGRSVSMAASMANAFWMQEFLRGVSRELMRGDHAVLVLDGAGCHRWSCAGGGLSRRSSSRCTRRS